MSENPAAVTGPSDELGVDSTLSKGARLEEGRPGDLLVEDVLVEEVSIDGMCGVY
ncbi:mycofactocin precursor MftA [Streptomyces sp. NPDC054786]